MSPIRKLLFVGVGVLALHGLQACASETELNPQPLPPQGGGEQSPTPPEEKTGDSTNAGGSSGSSGSSGVPASVADAATDAATDAADAGVD